MRNAIIALGGPFGWLAAGMSLAVAGMWSATAATAQPLQVAMMQGAQSCVALTFDDGPDATLTPKLLSILEAKNVHASFFVVGFRAANYPDIVARADKDGDDVGNHSWDHPVLPSLDNAAALRELTRTDAVIKQITGHEPAYSRAPYGSMSVRIAGLSPRTFVAWSVDTLDWKYPDVDRITRSAVGSATNGGIVLMHDVHPRTVEAVPGIIDGLQARGFRLVTLSELLSGGCGGTMLAYAGSGGEGPLPGSSVPALTASAGGGTVKGAVVAPAKGSTGPVPVQQASHSPAPYRVFEDDN